MRRKLAKIISTIRNILLVVLVFAFIYMVNLLRTIQIDTILLIAGFALSSFFTWVIYKIFHKPEKYINDRGYVVLTRENDLEHRFIAKQILKRDLYHNEVVHHINGKKTDNKVSNLCLMNREKHEHFHSWLSWKKSKTGSYPTFSVQMRVLEGEYGGTLLETINITKNNLENKSKNSDLPKQQEKISEKSEEKNIDTSKILFEELRALRKKLANEKNVPAYMVFDDKTLTALVQQLPETDEQLLQIKGVGPIKLQMYGSQFISVVKKYKLENKLTSKNKIDTA